MIPVSQGDFCDKIVTSCLQRGILKQPNGHDLRVLLVRLLFRLFADDSGIFNQKDFHLFIEIRTAADGSDTGPNLALLFDVLNTPEDKRQSNLDEDLAAFLCENGICQWLLAVRWNDRKQIFFESLIRPTGVLSIAGHQANSLSPSSQSKPSKPMKTRTRKPCLLHLNLCLAAFAALASCGAIGDRDLRVSKPLATDLNEVHWRMYYEDQYDTYGNAVPPSGGDPDVAWTAYYSEKNAYSIRENNRLLRKHFHDEKRRGDKKHD